MKEIIDSAASGAIGWLLIAIVFGLVWVLSSAGMKIVQLTKNSPGKMAKYAATIVLVSVIVYVATSPKNNTATCVLDDMPGIKSDVSAMAVLQICQAKYGGYDVIAVGSGKSIFFGYQSEVECSAHEARDTQSVMAAGAIQFACHCLYGMQQTFENGYLLACSSR